MKKSIHKKAKAKPKSKAVKKSSPKKVKKTVAAAKKKVSKTKPKAIARPAAKKKTVKAKTVPAKAPVKVVSKGRATTNTKAAPKSKFPARPQSAEKPLAPRPLTQKEKEIMARKAALMSKTTPVINSKMPYNKDEGRKIIRPKTAAVDPNKTRYSDKELEEFREIINRKLEDAKKELINLQAQLTSANEHGTDDTANTFKMLEDGSDSLAKEEAGQLASRQRKFIEQLENALVRIENKTYGICRVTGKLIPKERLRAVPHTTQSIEAKLNQYRD